MSPLPEQLRFGNEAFGGTKPLKFAFIIGPIDSLKAYKDSTVAMMRAGERHGHDVYGIECQTLGWRQSETGRSTVFGQAVRLRTRPDDHDWYRETGREWLPLKTFDAVVMRRDPPFDFEYLAATWLLDRAESEGVRVVNKPQALRDHSEKLAITEFSNFIPATVVASDMQRIQSFIDDERDVILKPLDGMGGQGIFRVHRNDPNRNSIVETLSQLGRRTIMGQKYLHEISQGDKRILLIGGKVVPFCLARIPKAGETRGNLSAGGTGVAQELSKSDLEIAETLAPILMKRGLMLVGIDVIGDHLTEINVTSPTCMVEIRQQTGFDVAGAFITALEHLCETS